MNAIPLSPLAREILYQLHLNCRISLTELSARLNTSKQAVSYHIRQMENRKIIRRYTAITNIYHLGKTHYRVFLKLQNLKGDKEQELHRYLEQHPQVSWIFDLGGDFDILFVIWADNIIVFEKIFDDIMVRFGKYVMEKYFSIATKVEFLPYSILHRGKRRRSPLFVIGDGSFDNHPLDELDRGILFQLNRDGRIFYSKLAEKLGVSSSLVKRRIDGLTRRKVISGFSINIDHRQLGYAYRMVMLKLLDTPREQLLRLAADIRNRDNMIYILKTIGTYDFEFKLLTRSEEEFFDLIKELRRKFSENIRGYNAVVIRGEPKYESLTW
ncbi:MAG: Lrp/AsnC family transcriptional regulator [Candidatus Krumholzibacteriota bacterium]|nr:Lrp/AsnC family transcriptional regulator [Candidatus Krumholzibacteriota bacterium]